MNSTGLAVRIINGTEPLDRLGELSGYDLERVLARRKDAMPQGESQ